jgi:ATP-dependent RNA helicase RhlE
VHIVVGTPGRVLDHLRKGSLDLAEASTLVLDEADRMLDMGFVRDVQDILNAIPKKRQSLFFSATMPPAIVKLAHDILDNPVRVEVAPARATVDLIEQSVYYIEKSKKPSLLLQLLDDANIRTALVFTRTKHGADSVVRTLERNHISADAIHGNKSQNARQRALDNFKRQKTRVLVATDIAARGIDVDNLECSGDVCASHRKNRSCRCLRNSDLAMQPR